MNTQIQCSSMPHGQSLKILSLHRMELRVNLKNTTDIVVLYFWPMTRQCIGEKFQSLFMGHWTTQDSYVSSVSGSKVSQSLAWKSRKIVILAYFKNSPAHPNRWKFFEPVFLEVFRSEPSNSHDWNTCSSDSVIRQSSWANYEVYFK